MGIPALALADLRRLQKWFTIDYPNSNHWRKVGWWHVYRMLRRQRWRRWRWDNETIGGEYDGMWEYATDEQCARSHLEATYGETI